MSASKKAPPAHVVRRGRVRVAVWKNHDTAGRAYYTMTIARGYKEGETWKESPSLNRDTGYQAARAIEEATDWIFAQSESD